METQLNAWWRAKTDKLNIWLGVQLEDDPSEIQI